MHHYGKTVDFNVVADSTSEAAAKFSGYYTVNGAVADKKLVFPTDYVKEDTIDYNGPIIRHQVSYYDYQATEDDLVWISQKTMKTVLDDEYITTRIGFYEDAQKVSNLEVFVDFMSIVSEQAITDECEVDLKTMTVKIPAKYKDADLTVRWFMPNASYLYGYEVDAKFMISNTPEKFKIADIDIDNMTLANEPGYSSVVFSNRVIRGDLSFSKKNADTGAAMAYIPFKITNNASGETHYVITDANGTFTSTANKAKNVNANDAVLSKYSTKDTIPQSVINALTKDAGVWFGLGSDGTMTKANASYGAFVYGTYTITEMKTEATKSMTMVTKTVSITQDGVTVAVGTINNVSVKIQTTLTDNGDGDQYGRANSTITLKDRIAYQNLPTGKTYTIKSTLYKKDGSSLTKFSEKTTTFQPTTTSGTTDVIFSNLSTVGLGGKSLVCYETLSCDGEFIAEHADPNDTNQTVTFPMAGIQVAKYDAQTKAYATPSANADLTGIRFAIINRTGSAIINYAGNEIPVGGVVQVITVDKTGYGATGASDLPIGSYIVQELREDATFDGKTFYEGKSVFANGSYLWANNQTMLTLTAAQNGSRLWASFYDEPITATPKFEKYDFELGKKATMAGTSFAGIAYLIYNDSEGPVVVNGKSYEKDEVIETIYSDANGNFSFKTALPIGHYKVKEGGNSHYVGSNETRYFHVIRSGNGGAIYYEPGYTSVRFSNRVRRGELSFVKKNGETGETLAYIPFKVTNTETGETHYILTDANGTFTSAANKGANVNANDAVLSAYTETDLIPQSVITSLVKDAGVWFGLGSDGSMTKATASYGSFVYGTYTVTELKTEATKNMIMVSETVEIHRDGVTVDLGTIENVPVRIRTTLTDADGDHYAVADSQAVLTDRVAYQNLLTETSYTLKATLYVKDGTNLTKFTEKTITFQPKEPNGTVDVLFGSVSTKGMAGKSFVCYENLSLDGELVAEHTDPNDEGQTIHFPTVKTTAVSKDTNEHIALADESATIVDTVELTGLCVGETYTLSGMLMDRETGKALTVGDILEITAESTFVATASSMQVPLTFTFDASELNGATTVVFESLSYQKKEVAVHADLEDEDQTVHFSKLTVLKIATDQSDVIGAKLEIRDMDGNVLEAFESEAVGNIIYRLAFNTAYRLVETEAPNEFTLAAPITFRLLENGKVLVNGVEQEKLVMVDGYSNGTLTLTKHSLGSDQLLAGAVYGVYSDETCTTLVVSLETDENGTASTTLDNGSYWIREIKAPAGYRLDDTVYGPYEISSEQTQVFVDMYDRPQVPVPTGLNLTGWPYLAAFGLGLLGLAIGFRQKKRKKI